MASTAAGRAMMQSDAGGAERAGPRHQNSPDVPGDPRQAPPGTVAVRTPGSGRRKKYLKPGAVGQMWARIAGNHRPSASGKRPASARALEQPFGGHEDGKDYPQNLAEISALLRQHKRRIVRDAAKLLEPQPALSPDEPLGLLTLPTELLARLSAATRCLRSCVNSEAARELCSPLREMKIIIALSHDELTPLMATCHRLRQAACAAKAVHFNFCTPSPQKDARDGSVLANLRSPIAPEYFNAALNLAAFDAPAAPPRQRRLLRRRQQRQQISGQFSLPAATPSVSSAGSTVAPDRTGSVSLASSRMKFPQLGSSALGAFGGHIPP